MSKKVKKGWYIAGILTTMMGIGFLAVSIIFQVISITNSTNALESPGITKVYIEKVGTYNFYYEYEERKFGNTTFTKKIDPSDIKVKVMNVDTGENINTYKSNITNSYSLGKTKGESFLDMEIQTTGNYEITIEGEPIVVKYGKSFGGDLAKSIVISIFTMMFTTGLGIIFIYLGYKQNKKLNENY